MPIVNFPKLKIVHKGLLLIAIPLLFGFVFVVVLQIQLQAFRDMRNKSVHAMRVSRQVFEMESQLRHLRGGEILSEKNAIALNAQLGELRTIAFKIVSSVTAKQDVEHIESDWHEFVRAGTLVDGDRVEKLCTELSALAERDLDWSLPATVEIKQFQTTMQMVLAALLILNVIVCPLVALYFSQNLLKRLHVLIDNSDRFASGKELAPPVSGVDEIAAVDDMFRDMVAKVRTAESAQRDFVAMINHDIRTPLNTLKGTLELLSDGVYGSLSDQGLARVKVAESTADELIVLVNQLLDIERVKSGGIDLKLTAVSLRNISLRAFDSVRGLVEFKNAHVEVPPNDILVHADELRLLQVLSNLIANAVKFGPDGNHVRVSFAALESARVEVEIADDGDGVPAGMEEGVFERYTQVAASSSLSGNGLGLAICKQLVEAHHGTIGVRRGTNGGSVFWFQLRAIEQAAVVNE